MIDIEWDDVDSLTFGHSFGRLSSSTTENLCPFNHVARAQINGSRVTKNIFECTPSFGHSQQSTVNDRGCVQMVNVLAFSDDPNSNSSEFTVSIL